MMMGDVSAGAIAAARSVYVVDDEPGVRMSVTHMIDAMDCIAWPFAGGDDLLGALPSLEPGCMLLDVEMPDMTGLDLMARLQQRACDWPIIVMTAHADVPMAVQAMKNGALEFIEKPFSATPLAAALARGFAALDERRRQAETREAARERLNGLTPRERNVLQAIVDGKQNKVVAHDLGLSIRTVEMHRSNLLAKLGLRTPQEALALVMRADHQTGVARL